MMIERLKHSAVTMDERRDLVRECVRRGLEEEALSVVRGLIRDGDDQLLHGFFKTGPVGLLRELRIDTPIVHASTGVTLRWCGEPPRQWWRLWCADVAEHVLPEDVRALDGIETARRYARGELTESELRTAHKAVAEERADWLERWEFLPKVTRVVWWSLCSVRWATCLVDKESSVDSLVAVEVAAAAEEAWAWGADARKTKAARAERWWQADRLVDWLTGART